MIIKAKSYNIPDITLDEPLDIGTNTIGTLDDYEHILNLIKESGLVYCRATIGDAELSGSMVCNIAPEGFEAFTITNQGENLRCILVYCYMDGSDFKLDLAVATLS